MFLLAPREAEVEKGGGEDGWDINDRVVSVDVGRLGRATECRERREKAVERVEKLGDLVRYRGMRSSDL